VVRLVSVLGKRNLKYFPTEMQVICTDCECGVNDMHPILNLYVESYPPKFIKSSNRPYTKAAEPSYCTSYQSYILAYLREWRLKDIRRGSTREATITVVVGVLVRTPSNWSIIYLAGSQDDCAK